MQNQKQAIQVLTFFCALLNRQGYFIISDVKKPADRVELKHAAYAKDETDWRDWQPSDRGPVVKADGRVELMPINSRASEKEREEAEWTSSRGSGGGGSSDFSPAPRSLAPDPASREAWRSGPRTLKGVQYNSAGGGMPIVGRVGLSLVGEDERRRENARNAAVRHMQRAELAGASNLDFRARQASIEVRVRSTLSVSDSSFCVLFLFRSLPAYM